MTRGLFITLEGGEGTGKSTQALRLTDRLKASGHDVVLTREPGGTPQGEALRNLLVSGDPGAWSANAEAMLNAAARETHVRQVIMPAIAAGKTVISDRFMDSTRVYQGFAGGADMSLIDALERAATHGLLPSLTLVFDLAPEVGLARAKARGTTNEDRFERKGLPFHAQLRKGFLLIARADPQRCAVIDASQSPDDVFSQCWSRVEEAMQRG
ncbi:MAG: dTMP kinase [Proteobacteria bacterium]|nr:dTMP kinase [Pseudomonadota bacterium]